MYAGTGSNTGMRLAEQLGLEGGFWDTLQNIAGKVTEAAPKVQAGITAVRGVVEGDSKVAVVPANGWPSLVLPSQQYPVGMALPSWVLPVAAAGALFLILRR